MGLGGASEGIPWGWSQGVTPVWLLNSSQEGLKEEELRKPGLKQTLLHPQEAEFGINTPDSPCIS